MKRTWTIIGVGDVPGSFLPTPKAAKNLNPRKPACASDKSAPLWRHPAGQQIGGSRRRNARQSHRD